MLVHLIFPDFYRASYAKAEVEVFEHLDSKVSIVYKGRKLKYPKIQIIKNQKERSLEEILLKGDISILQKS
ncbi:MAG: hypothetical protein NC904_02755 [Candidatus Omnitrophica bacterium]|nr:hypothetical protein [Candidatus Omnitrophota bacterium]